MAAYIHQRPLREAAERALVSKGYVIDEITQGGARLKARQPDGTAISILVRTAADRWVGWMRDDAGEWRGMDDGELIVAATYSVANEPTSGIEVYAFLPSDVRRAFDENLASRLEENPSLKPSAPVFVGLDVPQHERASSAGSNLKLKALWKVVPSEVAGREDAVERFKEDTRRNFAALVGVPVERVRVEFMVSY